MKELDTVNVTKSLEAEDVPCCPLCDQPVWAMEVNLGTASIAFVVHAGEAACCLVHSECVKADEPGDEEEED